MKVLHVLNELKPSGAETMLKSAAPFWRDLGVECEILATGASVGPYADTLREAGYPVHHLPSRRHPGYFLDFNRFVRNGGYQLVHQHAEGLSYWFGLATLMAGARLVRTVHSNFAFSGNLRWRRALQRRHLQAMGARFVAIAPGVHKNERSRFGVDGALVWNWLDTDHFTPITTEERAAARAMYGFREDEVVLVTIGNCSPVKNHGVLIEAIAKLPPTASVRYLHVGMEDDDHSERLHAEQLGISEKITFTGWMGKARDALAPADLFVMPSKYEGLGIAALEALSVGLPALLTRVDGLQDLALVFPQLLYADPNPESIAESLGAYMTSNPESRKQISFGYTELSRKNFSPERGVREYYDIYCHDGKNN
ncbi:MAG: glycosyltransferase [bacterium]